MTQLHRRLLLILLYTASGRVEFRDGDSVRLQTEEVSATDPGVRRGHCSQDVQHRGRSISVKDQVERGSSALAHQVTRLVH